MLFDILVVSGLVVLNGCFSLAELAVVSARRGALEQMADGGNRKARVALRLANQPGRFLATVQFGITLVSVLAGAFSGARLAEPLGRFLSRGGIPYPQEIAFGLVVAIITYVSIIFGELIPKQLALLHSARVAAAVARPMALLSRLALPIVALLDVSAAFGLRLLGQSRVATQSATEEEVRRLIAEGTRSGVFTPSEGTMIDRVIGLADRSVRTIMTPRIHVEWLDADQPLAESLEALRSSRHSRLLLCRTRVDDVVGIIRARDVMDRLLDGGPLDLAALAHPPAIVPDSASALKVLEVLKASPTRVAVVIDEHGSFEGLVTDADILESVAGAMEAAGEATDAPDAFLRPDGTWLVDADLDLDEARRRFRFPPAPDGSCQTLAGLVLVVTGHVPKAGERIDWLGWQIEVIDMDGLRIDKLMLTPPPRDEEDEA